MPVLLCFCTCPDAESAASLARALVEARLAACVNVLPGATSTYRWKDEVQVEAEHLLLIKTTAATFPALRDALPALHPYELPELLAVEAVDGLPAYLQWVADETGTLPA